MDYEKSATSEIAHNLEKKKTAKIFELITEHLGYEPVVSEALVNMRHSVHADGSETYSWGETPIVSFHTVQIPVLLSEPYTVKGELTYQSHITPKTDTSDV